MGGGGEVHGTDDAAQETVTSPVLQKTIFKIETEVVENIVGQNPALLDKIPEVRVAIENAKLMREKSLRRVH